MTTAEQALESLDETIEFAEGDKVTIVHHHCRIGLGAVIRCGTVTGHGTDMVFVSYPNGASWFHRRDLRHILPYGQS